jgi:ABC-type branched-subunit amino acid transport system permease subunit
MQNVIYPTSFMFSTRLVATAPRPHLGFINGESDRWLYYIVLVVTASTLAVLALIARGRLGRLLRAMAETPTMLSTHGLAVNMTRLIVFCISAFFAGIGGGLAITQTGSASGVGFGPIQSLLLVAVLAICGTRLLRSSILAATLLAVLPGYATGFGVDKQALAFGAIAIAAAIVIAKRVELTAWVGRAARTSDERLTHGPIASRGRLVRAVTQP